MGFGTVARDAVVDRICVRTMVMAAPQQVQRMRVWYDSCRHRACPQCNGLARERWLAQMRSRLIDGAHHHIIFTIPHEFNVLWMIARAQMTQLLFAAVRDTLMELLGDPRHLGAIPGIVMALHTWTRSLALHPHIHALVLVAT